MPANNNKHTDDTKKIVIDLFKKGKQIMQR